MEYLSFVLIHVIVPVAGLQTFLWVRDRMQDEEIVHPPIIPLIIICATYVGLLMLILTSFLWYASGLATLGMFYLIFVAPILMIIISCQLYSERKLSRYHQATFFAGVLYIGILTCLAAALFIWVQFFYKGS